MLHNPCGQDHTAPKKCQILIMMKNHYWTWQGYVQIYKETHKYLALLMLSIWRALKRFKTFVYHMVVCIWFVKLEQFITWKYFALSLG